MALEDLATGPLLYLGLTCATFSAAVAISRRSGGHPLTNPVLLSVFVLIVVLHCAQVEYHVYFANVQLIHFLLGPAVVALAVPLFRQHQKVRQATLPILFGVLSGSIAGTATTLAACFAFGLDDVLVASLSTKSVTAPVAMSIAEQIGGAPSLAAVFAVLTGMFGAALGPRLLDMFKTRAAFERGLAMGATSHGQGAARSLQESEETGAFAAIAMGATAIAMATVVPLVSWLVA